MTVNDKRPVNLELDVTAMPLPAIASILHRASGIFIFIGFAMLIWMLDASLASEASFNELKQSLSGPLAKFALWAVLSGFIYHSVVGTRHLIMDLGIGETLEGGVLGAKLALVISALLI